MTSRARVAVTLFAVVVFALVVLVPVSAQTRAPSKDGGTLVVGLGGGEPDALDPTLSRTASALEVYGTICEKLYRADNKGRIVPQLAAAAPVISKDRLTYTIPLRKGVRFNYGTPFNAQAVVTSLQRHMTLPGSSRASDLESIASIAVAGPYSVIIDLKRLFTPLPVKLSSAGYIMSPTQLAKLGDTFATSPVCVGPFMYDNRVAGDSVTVVKSPYYYNKNAVHLDKIVFKVASDAAAAAAALKAGDLQALDSISTTEVPSLKQTPSVRVIQANGIGWNGIFVNVGNTNGVGVLPYSNPGTALASNALLRKAFEEAIDRAALARVVFGGNVQGSCTPISPANDDWYRATAVKCTPYDPADAKKLVAASGIANPTVRLLTPNLTDSLRLAQFIQAEEAAVGINVSIDTADSVAALARANAGRYDTYLGSWSGGFDPDSNIYQHLASSGTRNTSGYSNPKVDALLDKAREAPTLETRAALYRAAQQIILNDRPIIYLYAPIKYAGMSSNVTGIQMFKNIILRVAFARFR